MKKELWLLIFLPVLVGDITQAAQPNPSPKSITDNNHEKLLNEQLATYLPAASKNDAQVQLNIALILNQKAHSCCDTYQSAKYSQQAHFFLEKAAELGCADAHYLIGKEYEHLFFAEKNEQEKEILHNLMYRHYFSAAEQKHAGACCALGDLCEKRSRTLAGHGKRTYLHEALRWYLKAYDQKNSLILLKIGLIYYELLPLSSGTVAMSNFREAEIYFLKAAGQKCPIAYAHLGKLHIRGALLAQIIREHFLYQH